jgi:hypothetical protein
MSATARKPRTTFEDLKVYQVAREFRKAMYRIAGRLPDVDKPTGSKAREASPIYDDAEIDDDSGFSI